MTDHEECSLRQRAIEHIAEVRCKLNPQTTEHIAHAAREAAPPELRAYAEYIGWKELKRLQEDAGKAEFRPGRNRSGHKNASGRFRMLRSILDMRYTLDQVSKTLGELTIPELTEVIQDYIRRSSELAAEAMRLETILREAEAKKVKHVAQLGAQRVEKLYCGEAVGV